MIRSLFSMACCLLFLVACSQTLETTRQTEVTVDPLSKTISVNEALNSLENFLSTTELKTKSGISSISEDDIFVIGAKELCPDTKSDNDILLPDTLLYALNFPNGGFSVLSANTDLNTEIMCVTENGQISPDSFSSGYSFLMSTTVDAATKISEEYHDNEKPFKDAGKDYLFSLLISSAIIDYCDDKTNYDAEPETKESSSNSSTTIGPLLMTKWTQDRPFNNRVNPPGCVVIAVAQIMAHNEVPMVTAFDNVTAVWDTLKTVYPSHNYESMGTNLAKAQVAYLAQELASSKYCDVDEGGGTTVDKAKSTMNDLGYKVDKRLGCGSGDIKKIDKQLTEDRTPVFMGGMRTDAITDTEHGHAWVIDGINGNMYHINWGWHGNSDGYYSKGIFNTASRVSYNTTNDPGTNTHVGNAARNYDHKFRILLYEIK